MTVTSGGYTGPREVSYLFIDAEQLTCTLEEVGNAWFGEPIDLEYSALQGSHQKVFYYDCLPAKKPDESDADYEGRKGPKASLFERLRALRGWHVSEGLAKHRKRSGQQQKEVDILMAVDVLTHTYRRNMHRMAFLSGDQDFAPLIESVVREGMYVELIYPEHHTSTDLKHFSDVAIPMDVDFLFGRSTHQFRSRHSLPSDEWKPMTRSSFGVLEERGWVEGNLVGSLWRVGDKYFVSAEKQDQYGNYRIFSGGGCDLVKRYAEYRLGSCEWRSEEADR